MIQPIPEKFRYVVTSERCDDKTRAYVAVSLEWHMAGQGDSPDDAIDELEKILVIQTYLIANPDPDDPPHVEMLQAPDDYFKAYESGQFVCTDENWNDLISDSKVHARGVLDIKNSRFKFKAIND